LAKKIQRKEVMVEAGISGAVSVVSEYESHEGDPSSWIRSISLF
jgi:hypothetical protein